MTGFLERRDQRRERARRFRRLGDCPECRHPWFEGTSSRKIRALQRAPLGVEVVDWALGASD